MIPSILDRQLRQGVADFVRTTFTITTPSMSKMVDNLCDSPDRMFKGPYISLGLPFENGKLPVGSYFPDINVPFLPFRHQELAWERIKAFQSTIIATGTGSGKTECFLFPVLNHVRLQKERGWSGIKAIFIYPMNALATDQARRIAKAIEADPALKGKITAGLYVGGTEENPTKVMGPETVITDRKALRLSPPDILLTNYKMLDYLFSRPKDKPLWDANKPGSDQGASTLRFLVVDELHTFDGAQGTDLALLIRRLKHRLGCLPGNLCCVGTSATLGGPDNVVQMVQYAGQIFGESFTPESLITEKRQSPGIFLAGSFMKSSSSGFPLWQHRADLNPANYKKPEDYLEAQAKIWFPEEKNELLSNRILLGNVLKSHVVFRALIDLVSAIPRTEKEILSELARLFESFDPVYIGRTNSGIDMADLEEFLSLSLSSIIALIAHARTAHTTKTDVQFPFVQQVRVQSWIRELRRMVATVSTNPVLDFADDTTRATSPIKTHSLPVVYCRECGNAGWVGLVPNIHTDTLRTDDKFLRAFYKTFFQPKPSPLIRFLFPDLKGRAVLKPGHTAKECKVCVHCLDVMATSITVCHCGKSNFVEVLVPDSQDQDTKGHWYTRKHCPGCGSRQSLVVLGAQSASLSSALINQLFASPYTTDKKLIAFSDNVQDAAHRASFFGARTWKFNFRAAIQQYVQEHAEPQPLVGLGEKMLGHWKSQFKNENNTVAMFLPADLEWLGEVREARDGERKSFSDKFWSDLSKRVDWEVFTEYGLDSRKGRTLEKSGCSIAYVAHTATQSDYDDLSIRIQNIDPTLQDHASSELLKKCVQGIIKRWLNNGAIDHPALSSYISSLGNPYIINKNILWMKGIGGHSSMPSFPWRQLHGKDSQERLDPIQTRPEKPTSWYAHWLLKHWGHVSPMFLSHFESAMSLILEFMEKTGIAIRSDVDKTSLWMLNPDNIRISREVQHFRCQTCGHQVSAASSEKQTFNGLHCLKAACSGLYTPYNLTSAYYGDLYKNGNLVRLMPHEHTSLLGRDERENIEKQFKAKAEVRSPWAPNLLSCTPTLELGIDIGDLSSVLLCSVPPEQAAFMQRIGRAGRTDGNAVVSTIAEGQPHDLYFWADPLEMLSGKIEPPGVFLDATAVLERQLVAFCLDRWVFIDPVAAIPKQVSAMISNWKSDKKALFPTSFLNFISNNTETILADFFGLLGSSTSPDTRDYLRGFLDCTENTGIKFKMNDCLSFAEKMRNSLTSRRKQLDSDINRKKIDPAVNLDLVQELQMERDALSGLIRNIDERDCYQFLTDEGLIPNYAFPEAGIQLKSIIYRRDRSPGGSGPKSFKQIFEYERAAAAAISDFAPGNFFYAHGRKVQIDQVDQNVSPVELHRFCPECGFSELETTDTILAECPQCQSIQFGGKQQVQQVMRIRQVYATSSDRRSLVGDDSESREVRFFERSMLIGLRNSELLGAWKLDDVLFPFGFEVRRKVLLREFNFGPYKESDSSVRIAGKDISAHGFEICKSCGKVSLNNKGIEHTFHCAQQHLAKNQQILESTFLFREFMGEAIRIFLPTLSEGAENDINSFLAAFHLGLKLHYQGDVSHLQATLQSEPVSGNPDLRKQFIVLFDRIPGGTGYLKQFTQDPTLIRTILQKAFDRMASCACQYTSGRDGCYRCLLAHRNSREIEIISRKTALELLKKVLNPKSSFKPLDNGVSTINLVQALESELERKFISALESYGKLPGSEYKVIIEAKTLSIKNGYHLSVNGQPWIIETQINLNESKGTSVPTRIDFLISHAQNKTRLPIALSLDGWEYHHTRMETDTRQRLALHRTGKFRVWTITWDDIDDALKSGQVQPGLLDAKNSDVFRQFLSKRNLFGWENIGSQGSLQLLLKYLADPDDDKWQYVSYGLILSNSQPEQTNGAAWVDSISLYFPSMHPGWNPLWNGIASMVRNGSAQWHGWIGRNLKECALLLRINDAAINHGEEKECWQNFWRTVNVFQFASDFVFVTEQGFAEGSYNNIPMVPAKNLDSGMSQAWVDVLEMCGDTRLALLLKNAAAQNVNPPVAFHEIVENDAIVAQTEIAWPDKKVAIALVAEDEKILSGYGWKVQLIESIDTNQFLTWLKE